MIIYYSFLVKGKTENNESPSEDELAKQRQGQDGASQQRAISVMTDLKICSFKWQSAALLFNTIKGGDVSLKPRQKLWSVCVSYLIKCVCKWLWKWPVIYLVYKQRKRGEFLQGNWMFFSRSLSVARQQRKRGTTKCFLDQSLLKMPLWTNEHKTSVVVKKVVIENQEKSTTVREFEWK